MIAGCGWLTGGLITWRNMCCFKRTGVCALVCLRIGVTVLSVCLVCWLAVACLLLVFNSVVAS